MSRALHVGFEPIGVDPASSFVGAAPRILHAEALCTAFCDALLAEGAVRHLCCAVDLDGTLLPLIGDDATLADAVPSQSLLDFPVETLAGDMLTVRIACTDTPDRARQARLHVLANLYATHAVILLEAQDEQPEAEALTALERRCMAMMIGGLSFLDIGEQTGHSAPAIRVILRRVAQRLNAPSIAEAATVALARNLVGDAPFPIGKTA